MTFLKLTHRDGSPMIVNLDQIQMMKPYTDSVSNTAIYTTENVFYAKETFDQILSKVFPKE